MVSEQEWNQLGSVNETEKSLRDKMRKITVTEVQVDAKIMGRKRNMPGMGFFLKDISVYDCATSLKIVCWPFAIML